MVAGQASRGSLFASQPVHSKNGRGHFTDAPCRALLPLYFLLPAPHSATLTTVPPIFYTCFRFGKPCWCSVPHLLNLRGHSALGTAPSYSAQPQHPLAVINPFLPRPDCQACQLARYPFCLISVMRILPPRPDTTNPCESDTDNLPAARL